MSESPTPIQNTKLDAIFIINIVSLLLTFISTVILGLKLRMKCCCGEISMKGKDNTSKDSPSPVPDPPTPAPAEPAEPPPTSHRQRGRDRKKRSSLERRGVPHVSHDQKSDEDEEEIESPAGRSAMPTAPPANAEGSTKSSRPSSVIIKKTKGGDLIIEKTDGVTVQIEPETPKANSVLAETEKK